MADSDGSPQRDDRHHRRSRSRSPASPEWTGETLADREERRLAEAAVLVGPPPPAREPEPAPGGGPRRSGSGDRSPSEPRRGPDRGPRHAADTGDSPGAGTGRIAEGCRSGRGEGGGRARGCDRGPGGPRHRLGRPRRNPQHAAKAGDGPRTGHGRLAGGRHSSRGERGGRARGCDRGPGGPRHCLGWPRRDPQHAAKAGDGPGTGHGRLAGGRHSSGGERGGRARGCDRGPGGPRHRLGRPHRPPSTPRKRGKGPARATGASPAAAAAAAVGRESAKYRAHANPTHTHTSPPKQFPPKPFPPGRARHVRPPAPERSPPGVTLPQLQRQRDARRVIQEGG